jgi:flagellar basal-body rod protein FlgC
MNLFGLMETSGSAMQAERVRAEVVAANMANAETTGTANGTPYHRQHVVFAANRGAASPAAMNSGISSFADSFSNASGRALLTSGPSQPMPLLAAGSPRQPAGGVHIAQVIEDPAPPLKRYDPGHPDAGPDGYVSYPDINPLTEMVDLMGATRAYGLNGSAVQAEKGMIAAALEIARS